MGREGTGRRENVSSAGGEKDWEASAQAGALRQRPAQTEQKAKTCKTKEKVTTKRYTREQKREKTVGKCARTFTIRGTEKSKKT